MKTRVIGYVSSLIFTILSFLIVLHPQLFHLSVDQAIFVILSLAILQAMAQSVFFLHVLSEKKPRWNLLIYLSTITVVIIIIAFSIWIMNDLDKRMM